MSNNNDRASAQAAPSGTVDMREVARITIILTLICVVITALLAGTNELTAKKIAENSLAAKQDAWREVLGADDYVDIVLSGSDADREVFDKLDAAVAITGPDVGGVVITTTDKGYGGAISVLTGFDRDGNITGVRLLEHSETAGLGANAASPKFTDQFVTSGTDVPDGTFAVAKDGGDIDAVTAATISSRAVTRAVNKACAVYRALRDSGYIRLPAGYAVNALPPASGTDALPEAPSEAGEQNGGENNG